MNIKFIYDLIKFPLWEDDGVSTVELNELQRKQTCNYINKIKNKEYQLVQNNCLCGKTDRSLDTLISAKDRYGIPCENVLCNSCGLIRLDKILDVNSLESFYKHEYRDIYVGEELASSEFFDDQIKRGISFYNLLSEHVNINEIRSVFEIGCGAGGILYPFKEEGKIVSGCDYGEVYLELGQKKGLDLYHGEMDVHKTPFKSQDLVILSHVMEHFSDPTVTMNEIIQLISPSKYLLIEVPGIYDIKKTYCDPIMYFQNAHIHNYFEAYLRCYFDALGLEVIYGNERCTFILKKPKNWCKYSLDSIEFNGSDKWARDIENELKKNYLLNLLKLNPYFFKKKLSACLDFLGMKKIFINLSS